MSNAYGNDEDVDPAMAYIPPLNHFEQLIAYRGDVENTLKAAYGDLVQKYRMKCAEADRERRNATIWEKQSRDAEKELLTLKSLAEASAFAFVIIDGDGAVFREHLIARGEEGGGQAAHDLYVAIKHHLQEAYNVSHLEIYVQVVLNTEGLTKALFNSGILGSTDDRAILSKFGRGFCRAQPLFSFVDVGFGKEQADHKVRKALEMMDKNVHCRALILGGCHDNGYATFLESFRNSRKIGLLETTPTAAGFRKLPFHTFAVPGVFRSEPLPQPRQVTAPPGFSLPLMSQAAYQATARPTFSSSSSSNGSPIAKPATPAPSASRAEAKKENDPRPNTWATVGRHASVPQVIDISTQKKAPPKERAFYLLNASDSRLDTPLPRIDSATQDAFNEKVRKNGANFCNRYHLLGSCKVAENGGKCPYIHGDRLSTADQNVLRLRARGLPCQSGLQCRDMFCTSGHHCSNPRTCYYGDGCRFAETHSISTKPTLKVHEDGTREIIV
ncbi:hypothetical protein QBC47DRAFT_379807 [Echria macrotheca]|uniref:C3H1-type domain-containing protein n=1 Tax=Echria macrotheca TaxID=438768 RepID=A0AAJ0BEH7_9PEZI|nr:hypothetical protein QBC47DRAFT_379807 [Echria macrotheca]